MPGSSLTDEHEPGSGEAELELLLTCTRTELDTAAEERLHELLGRGIDEARLWRLAADHCVEPLVYLSLVRHAPEGLSQASLASAKERFEVHTARTLSYTRELHRILDWLERGGVRAVPYKGPLLAEVSYGNLLARTFYDLDVAIRMDDIQRARDILFGHGYRSERERTPAQEQAYLEVSHEYELRSADGRIALELHWLFSERQHPIGVRPQDLWDQLERRKLMGREVWSFPPEALLCVLASHGSGHQWMRLDWIACIAEHVRAHPDLDWQRVNERAGDWGVLRATHLGLVLASELLGAPVPERVLREANATRHVPQLVRIIRSRLRREPGTRMPLGEWLTYALHSREQFGDRWPYFRYQVRNAWKQATSSEGTWRGLSRLRTWRFMRLLAESGGPVWVWRLLRG